MAVLNICNIIFCSRVGLKNNHGAHRAKADLNVPLFILIIQSPWEQGNGHYRQQGQFPENVPADRFL